MEENIEKVDYRALKEQMEKEIKEKGSYAEVHILVGEGERHSIPHVEIKDANLETVVSLLAMLDEIKKDIVNEFPIAGALEGFIKIQGGDRQSFDEDGNEIER